MSRRAGDRDESTPTSIEQRAQCLLSLPRARQHEGAGHLARLTAATYLDEWRWGVTGSMQASFRPLPTFEADVANRSPARRLRRQRRQRDIVSDDLGLLGIAIEHPLREQSPDVGVEPRAREHHDQAGAVVLPGRVTVPRSSV